jgi:5-methylcytosine-specific restriction enzyme A
MARSVPEWIGKTDDIRPPEHVRLRIFMAHGGVCHIAKGQIPG